MYFDVHLSMYIKSYDYIVSVLEKYLSHWKAVKKYQGTGGGARDFCAKVTVIHILDVVEYCDPIILVVQVVHL
jgi:hypothetical protein